MASADLSRHYYLIWLDACMTTVSHTEARTGAPEYDCLERINRDGLKRSYGQLRTDRGRRWCKTGQYPEGGGSSLATHTDWPG